MMDKALCLLVWGDHMGLSRNENILENILGAENDLPEPVSRIEVLLLELLDLIQELKLKAESDGDGNVELSVNRGESNE